ncbi:MAG: CoA ester lyase [Gammaproteobacteria bacterium]|nr:CoA ester lyase [Gammaproteobacteria bacterium]
MSGVLPFWRSLLFVPANVPKFIDKAPSVGADGIQFDLEDAVAPSEKPAARKAVPLAARKLKDSGADIVVRINRPWRLAIRDLEEVVVPEVDALTLPMVDSAEHIKAISEIVGELESERGLEVGRIKLIGLIEETSAFFRAESIARADPRLVAISLGSEDFARSAGMISMPETLNYPKQHIVFAARAAGIRAMGFIGSIADFRDMDAFRLIVQRSKLFGFRGASCIHPTQVTVCNEEFAPSQAEAEEARKIVAAYDEALAAGIGAINLDGKMIDVPVADSAREIVELDDALRARGRAANPS